MSLNSSQWETQEELGGGVEHKQSTLVRGSSTVQINKTPPSSEIKRYMSSVFLLHIHV